MPSIRLWGMAEPSGLFKAGSILVLVGAILSAAGAFFLIIASVVLLALGSNILGGETESTFPATVVGVVYLVLSLMMAVGSIFGFQGYKAAKRGDVHAGWVKGLVCALLPPLQAIPLIGAILLLVSPEHEASRATAPQPGKATRPAKK